MAILVSNGCGSNVYLTRRGKAACLAWCRMCCTGAGVEMIKGILASVALCATLVVDGNGKLTAAREVVVDETRGTL